MIQKPKTKTMSQKPKTKTMSQKPMLRNWLNAPGSSPNPMLLTLRPTLVVPRKLPKAIVDLKKLRHMILAKTEDIKHML